MQILYSKNRDPFLQDSNLDKLFDASVKSSGNLYLFQLYLIEKICRQAKMEADLIANKYIPTEEDKAFTPLLFNNDLIQSLVNNKKLQKLYEKSNFPNLVDQDILKNIYSEFAKTDLYKKYADKNIAERNHLETLLELYRFLRKNKLFNETVEDQLYNWEDDESLIIGAIKKTLKSLPASNEEFYQEYMTTEAQTLKFGKDLLNYVQENDDQYTAIIKPILKNWDSERVAVVDMILLKMAIAEFLNFPSIPTTASLNEYVELSKLYSTPKSKEFVNGVLDKIMKDLTEKKLIKKEGRGLIEEA